MQLRFGRLDVRALLDQFRRQADRQLRRQVQRGELEFLGRCLARKPADQRRQQIALHAARNSPLCSSRSRLLMKARRALAAAMGVDWPRDRLQVQGLDDSTNESPELEREAVAAAQ